MQQYTRFKIHFIQVWFITIP